MEGSEDFWSCMYIFSRVFRTLEVTLLVSRDSASEIARYKRHSISVQQQMQSQLTDLREKLTHLGKR